jgi:hypothetical protein
MWWVLLLAADAPDPFVRPHISAADPATAALELRRVALSNGEIVAEVERATGESVFRKERVAAAQLRLARAYVASGRALAGVTFDPAVPVETKRAICDEAEESALHLTAAVGAFWLQIADAARAAGNEAALREAEAAQVAPEAPACRDLPPPPPPPDYQQMLADELRRLDVAIERCNPPPEVLLEVELLRGALGEALSDARVGKEQLADDVEASRSLSGRAEAYCSDP